MATFACRLLASLTAPLALGAALLALGPGCKSNAPSGGLLEDCPDGRCLSPALGGKGAGAGGAAGAAGSPDTDGGTEAGEAGDDAAGGAAGSAGASGAGGGASPGGSLTGEVLVVVDALNWLMPPTYTKGVLLSAPGSDPVMPAMGMFAPPGPYSLPSVQGGDVFVTAIPADAPMLVLGGNERVHVAPGQTDGVNLRVVQTDVLNSIVTQVPVPTTLDLEAAHAVLFFVDAQGAPVSGISTTNLFNAVAVYDDANQYTQQHTHNRGIAVLLNAVPDAEQSFTYTTPAGVKVPAQIPLRKHVVSFLTLTVAP